MISFGVAKHDVWLSAVLAALLGLTGNYLLIALGLRYPSQTVIQYSQQILGSWAGRFIGLLYINFFLLIAALTTRDFAELFLLIMPDTPISVFIGVILLMAAYTSVHGLEVIARTSEVLVPFLLLGIIVGILGNIPNMDLLNLLPVLEDGWQPVIIDGITQVPYLGLAVFWLFLLPSLNIKTGAKKTLLFSISIVSLVILLVSITIVVVLGSDTPVTLNYQFFNVVRQISLANIIERIEPMFLISWSSTSFLAVTLFYYITATSIKQWLGLKNYRPLILPIGAVIFTLSIFLFPSYAELRQFFSLERFGMMAIPIEFGIPLVLLGLSYIKDKIIKQG